MLVDNDEIVETQIASPEPTPNLSDQDQILEYHLSFNAFNGSMGADTMCFKGNIQGMEIQILLDRGSSYNFLQPRIAHCLKITVHSAGKFQVLVGNGSNLTSEGYILDLPISVQGHMLHVPVYLLSFTGVDLILGSPWLKKLGPHIADYDALSIKFYLQN